MSTLTGLISSGGGGGGETHLGVAVLTQSTTFTVATDVVAMVYVIGGGGGGAAGIWNRCTGGGAGGCAVSKLTLTAGTTYTATIGAGGAGGSRVYSASGVAGGASGGTSSFSGSGITTMSAGGGGGGTGGSSNPVAGGVGGGASGGTLANTTGGAGGAITSGSTVSVSIGGDVGLFFTPPSAIGDSWPVNLVGYNPFPFEVNIQDKNRFFNEASWSGSTIYYYYVQPQPAGARGTVIDQQTSVNDYKVASRSGPFAGGIGLNGNFNGLSGFVIAGSSGLGGGGGGASSYYTAYAGSGGVGAVIIQVLGTA